MAASHADPYRVEANADKALFVSMLIKDIELQPAVLDLVDNSVDSARSVSPEDLSKFEIDLEVSGDHFIVKDNCGGIDLETARNYAFRFGRPKEYAGVPGSVGQFGVGMKRALFKLGRKFEVESRSKNSYFQLSVDVEKWALDTANDWHFTMTEVDDKYDPATEGTGTIVKVSNLHGNVIEDFSSALILGQLREQLRLRHQGVLQQGLTIRLNGEKLRGLAPSLLSGPGFSPFNKKITIPAGEDDVHVTIVAGIVARSVEDLADDGEAEAFSGNKDNKEAGWWVFCNDRLLIYADRTSTTGWGASGPAYHPQYREFRGYVYFESRNTSLLPWNTTKTGVDQDSKIWRQVLGEMKSALSEVLSVISRIKSEKRDGSTDEDKPVSRAADDAKPTPIRKLPLSPRMISPPLRSAKRPLPRKTTQKVQYDVDYQRYRDVRQVLGVSSTAEVGRRTFDYFYDREVEE
ncbi:ATP-binding protein [Amycolatopsis sp. WAC 01375]|uniref:ATP-binding protein n=1 Tax=Amycolatopsis sp. WAC 01375 TaxID=2203194 RepID=UPI001F3514D4|nr:ATP-binding protein [Amycolatopsis sp. WAC 01375]